MEIIRAKTVSFANYNVNRTVRNAASLKFNVMFKTLYDSVCEIQQKNYDTFITRLCGGFELLAAESVLWAKDKYPHIKLVIVVPDENYENRLSPTDNYRYQSIMGRADAKIVLKTDNAKNIKNETNEFLLANSSQMICYCNGLNDENIEYIKRAKQMGVNMINLCPSCDINQYEKIVE